MIDKKTVLQNIRLVDFPEEIDEQNRIKLYGETSWENQLIILLWIDKLICPNIWNVL